MQSIEERVLSKEIKGLLIFLRYVDDVLIVWKRQQEGDVRAILSDEQNIGDHNIEGVDNQNEDVDNQPDESQNEQRSRQNPEKLIEELAHLRPEIKYVMEGEPGLKVNFIDFTFELTREGLTTKIYRKPTYTWDIPKWKGRGTKVHKKVAVFPLLIRANKLLYEEDVKAKELKLIFGKALNEGYPFKELKHWNTVAKHIVTKRKDESQPEKIFRRIRPTQMDNAIKKVLDPHKINIINRKDGTLFEMIQNDKERREELETPGVYGIPLVRKK